MTDHAEKLLDEPSGIRDDLRWLKRLCVPDGGVITHSEVCLRVDRIVSEVVRSCERDREQQAELVRMREIIQHCWIHSGYHNCGYQQMSSEQKKLYDSVIDPGATHER